MTNKLEGGWRVGSFVKEFSPDRPVITIITAVYNSSVFFEETILSIINQSYTNLEYIVIDGGSTDGTIDILRKYSDQIAYWVSEPDKGISDAFNKGIELSTGTYINFQGAGDLLDTDDALANGFNKLSGEPVFVSGQIKRVDEFDSEKVFYISKDNRNTVFNAKSLLWKMTMPHQGLFTHRSYFNKYGLFDTALRFSMDYEHLLRAYRDFPKVAFTGIIARWRADGLGNNRELDIYKEYNLIKIKNRIESKFCLRFVNIFILAKHFLKRSVLSAMGKIANNKLNG